MQTLQKPTLAKTGNRLVMICSKVASAETIKLPFVMATIAAAVGMEVELYFTLWGLNALARKMTGQLQKEASNERGALPSVKELVAKAKEAGVKLYACGPSMKMMGLVDEDLIPEVDGIIDSTTYMDIALVKQELYLVCLTDSPPQRARKTSA